MDDSNLLLVPSNAFKPPGAAFQPSYENSFIAELAKHQHCVDASCVLSHKLAKLDRSNFGVLYSDAEKRTNLFPVVCDLCLLAKFGLYESYSDYDPILNCIVRKSQGVSAEDFMEGPFLKAKRSISNMITKRNVVFEKDTLIIPSGQVLVDVLMSNNDELYRTKSVPKIRLKDSTLTLNPYLFGYFKHLYDTKNVFDPNEVFSNKVNGLEDLLACENSVSSPNLMLDGTYEVDALMIGNLVTPTARHSNYVRDGEIAVLGDAKELDVTVFDNLNQSAREQISFDNHYVKDVKAKNGTRRIEGVEPRKIQFLNQLLRNRILNTKQLIHKRKESLLEYFRVAYKDWAAIDLHLLSFCLPHKLFYKADVFREYLSNVKLIPGIGLVSTLDICKEELLIANTTVHLTQFAELKMSHHEHTYTYQSIDTTGNVDPARKFNVAREGRGSAFTKQSLYSKL